MIRRLLALFALLTLASVSAASAHEHGRGHPMAAPVAAVAQQPATPATIAEAHHAVAWLASSDPSACSDTDETGHSHAKLAGCTCPAACAGLFGTNVAAPHVAAEIPAGTPSLARRLSAMSAAPPTPPPRA